MSPLENLFRGFLERLAPNEHFEYNERIYTGAALGDTRTYRKPDILHVTSGIIAECDGFTYHEAVRDTASDDKLRDRVLKRAGYETVRYSGDQIREDPEACARDYLEFCGVEIEENPMSQRQNLVVTSQQFKLAIEDGFTANTSSCGFLCVVSALGYNKINSEWVYVDPAFKLTTTKAAPRFNTRTEEDDEGLYEAHVFTYHYADGRNEVVLSREESEKIRQHTAVYDAYRAGELEPEEYLAAIDALAPFVLVISINPDTDRVTKRNIGKPQPKKTNTKARTSKPKAPKAKPSDPVVEFPTDIPVSIPQIVATQPQPVVSSPEDVLATALGNPPATPVKEDPTYTAPVEDNTEGGNSEAKKATNRKWSRDKTKEGDERFRSSKILAAAILEKQSIRTN